MKFEDLKIINQNKLDYYEQLVNQGNSQEQIQKEIAIHSKIKKLFDNNEGLFFQISMEEALKILSKLIPEENLKEVYTDLISPNNFEDLRRRFKI